MEQRVAQQKGCCAALYKMIIRIKARETMPDFSASKPQKSACRACALPVQTLCTMSAEPVHSEI